MAAANTDKFKKLSRKWVGQIGAGGVADDTTATIPLASTTNLPTDTAVVAVIDRVDSSGTKTPTLEETVIGVVSGNNLVTCVRGSEGTAQAHNAGAVVEILVTAKGWNDMVDGFLVAHNQDGTHSSSIATLTGSQTLANKTLTSPVLNTGVSGDAVLDEDNMASDSATKLATQQSIKAYADTKVPKPASEAQGDILYRNATVWARLAAGTSGKFLKTQGAGADPIWDTPSSSSTTAKARAYASAAQDNIPSNAWTKIVLGTESYDPGNNFATSTFTVPTTGYYQVNGCMAVYNGTSGARIMSAIYLNGGAYAYSFSPNIADGYGGATVSDVVYATAGQTIELYGIVVGNSTTDIFTGTGNTYMSVHLLST